MNSAYTSIIPIYVLIINVTAFMLYRIDKRLSIKKRQRISENTLLFIAIIGGSIGSFLGMYIGENHKTNKWHFKFGVPIIFVLQIIFIFKFN